MKPSRANHRGRGTNSDILGLRFRPGFRAIESAGDPQLTAVLSAGHPEPVRADGVVQSPAPDALFLCKKRRAAQGARIRATNGSPARLFLRSFADQSGGAPRL